MLARGSTSGAESHSRAPRGWVPVVSPGPVIGSRLKLSDFGLAVFVPGAPTATEGGLSST